MLQGGSCGIAMIFENERVAKPLIVLQVQHAIAIGPQNVLNRAVRQGGESALVIGGLNDHFVRAHAIHAVKQAIALAVEVAFDAQRGKFIGNYTNGPTGRIRASAVAPVGQNFRRGLSSLPKQNGQKPFPQCAHFRAQSRTAAWPDRWK